MYLNKENVTRILSQNFGFPVVQNSLVGPVIQLSALDAYFYSAVTGHAYLNDPKNGFSPNGLMCVFNQANAYNLITGMFNRNGYFNNTPLLHAMKHPFILTEPKYILPLEYHDHYSELQEKTLELYKRLTDGGFNPSDFIVCRISLDTAGYHMEPFCEYVVSEYFNRRCYLTETQIPFYYSGGTPDLAAYEVPDIVNILRTHGITPKGSSFIEIASFRIFDKHQESGNQLSSSVETIVGEVKTASLKADKQIQKYLSFQLFNKAYEIIPHKPTPEVISGLITFDGDGYIRVMEAQQPAVVNQVKQQEYLDWLSNYIKYFLIANLSNEELDEFYSHSTGRKSRSVNQLIAFVNGLDYEKIVARVISNG
jgi:hypothetical protein